MHCQMAWHNKNIVISLIFYITLNKSQGKLYKFVSYVQNIFILNFDLLSIEYKVLFFTKKTLVISYFTQKYN